MSTAVAAGKLVGGSATIDHALAFEPPRPVIRDWHDRLGATFSYDDLTPHLEAIRKLLRIAPVSDSQVSGSNLMLRRGVRSSACRTTAPPCATRTSASAAGTATWAAATIASSRR